MWTNGCDKLIATTGVTWNRKRRSCSFLRTIGSPSSGPFFFLASASSAYVPTAAVTARMVRTLRMLRMLIMASSPRRGVLEGGREVETHPEIDDDVVADLEIRSVLRRGGVVERRVVTGPVVGIARSALDRLELVREQPRADAPVDRQPVDASPVEATLDADVTTTRDGAERLVDRFVARQHARLHRAAADDQAAFPVEQRAVEDRDLSVE